MPKLWKVKYCYFDNCDGCQYTEKDYFLTGEGSLNALKEQMNYSINSKNNDKRFVKIVWAKYLTEIHSKQYT